MIEITAADVVDDNIVCDILRHLEGASKDDVVHYLAEDDGAEHFVGVENATVGDGVCIANISSKSNIHFILFLLFIGYGCAEERIGSWGIKPTACPLPYRQCGYR